MQVSIQQMFLEIDESLIETEFQIEIDNRLGSIVDRSGKTFLSPTAIDDDNVATYIIRKPLTRHLYLLLARRHLKHSLQRSMVQSLLQLSLKLDPLRI